MEGWWSWGGPVELETVVGFGELVELGGLMGLGGLLGLGGLGGLVF